MATGGEMVGELADGTRRTRTAAELADKKAECAEPEEFLICDICGHDAWHLADLMYEYDEGHIFWIGAPKPPEATDDGKPAKAVNNQITVC